jgi:hypothetical protein
MIYGELLIGDVGGRQALLDAYEKIQHAAPVPHRDLVSFVRHRRLHGRGVGWIDIHLLASALVAGMRFWTADPRLAALAREMGVSYDPPERPSTLVRM